MVRENRASHKIWSQLVTKISYTRIFQVFLFSTILTHNFWTENKNILKLKFNDLKYFIMGDIQIFAQLLYKNLLNAHF